MLSLSSSCTTMLMLCTVAILTDRIHDMAVHMKKNHKDYSAKRYDSGKVVVQGRVLECKHAYHIGIHTNTTHPIPSRGLEAMLQKRKRLLMYLRRKSYDRFSMLITRLGLKDNHMRMVC